MPDLRKVGPKSRRDSPWTFAELRRLGNPRPGVEIQSLDLVYDKDKDCGMPALLAVTAATAQ